MTGNKTMLAIASAALLAMVGCGDDNSGTGNTAGSGGAGGSGSEVCVAACGNIRPCIDDMLPSCPTLCAAAEEMAAGISQQCQDDLNSLLSCLGGLQNCADVLAWSTETPANGYPCQAQTETCNAACSDECLSNE